jgi:hypothetical protein
MLSFSGPNSPVGACLSLYPLLHENDSCAALLRLFLLAGMVEKTRFRLRAPLVRLGNRCYFGFGGKEKRGYSCDDVSGWSLPYRLGPTRRSYSTGVVVVVVVVVVPTLLGRKLLLHY